MNPCRKKVCFLILFSGVLALTGVPALQQEADLTRSLVLDNGLKVFLFEKHTLPVVNCVMAVDLGSKDETESSSGLVHILEHYILFRGTEQRSGEEIALDMRRHGAYFNAHTGRDLSMFEITLPSQHSVFGLQSLREMLFDLKIQQEALDEEKQVILEEIKQMQDDPVRLATGLVYQNLFPGHPYQRPIYGHPDVIDSVSAEQMHDFYEKYLVPSNSSLAVVGDFTLSEMETTVKSVFAGIPDSGVKRDKLPKTQPLSKTVEIEHEMDVKMAYLAIGLPGPDYNSTDQYAMDLLTEVFGRGINPMLYHPLVQKRIQVNSLRMGYGAHRYGGAITITMALEEKHLRRAKSEITRYLKQARRLNYSSDDVFGDAALYAMDYIDSAKNRIRFNGEQGKERGLAVAASLARFMLLNEIPERGDYLDHIEKLNSTDLREAAGRYLAQKNLVIVTVKPKKKK